MIDEVWCSSGDEETIMEVDEFLDIAQPREYSGKDNNSKLEAAYKKKWS